MATKTYIGGTHRVTDPGVFLPDAPVTAEDTGLVVTGHVTAINQTVGPYALALDGSYTTSTFDALGGTITGFVGTAYDPFTFPEPSPSGTVGLIGLTVNQGTIGASGYYLEGSFPQLAIQLADVASPTAVIKQAILVNTGSLIASEGSPVTLTGPADAVVVNNGSIFGGQFNLIDAAITGTGQIEIANSPRDSTPVLTVTKAVGSGQTISLEDGTIDVKDPIDFRATVATLIGTYPDTGLLFEAPSTAASFIDHTLTLTNAGVVVTQFRFADNITVDDFAIDAGPATTLVRSSFDGYAPGNLTVTTTGVIPSVPTIKVPAPVTLLPPTGPDRTVTNGALVASAEILARHTIRLENPFATTQASLSISSVTFASTFALKVDALRSGQSHGNLYAVGYNANAGLVQAAGSGSTLAVDIEDIVAPDGVVVLAGAFNNTGRLAAETGGTLRITGPADSKLINAGTVVTDGMTFIGPTVTGNGRMTVGNHGGVSGSLELGGYVSTGQAITLGAGTLTIDDARQFLATVYDFDRRDAIVLKGLDVRTVTYDNGRLLLDGGADGTLHFHRPDGVGYTSASFQISHSGGDTILTTPVRTA